MSLAYTIVLIEGTQRNKNTNEKYETSVIKRKRLAWQSLWYTFLNYINQSHRNSIINIKGY